MPTQRVVPVQCPNCQAQFTAPIQNIVDGQDMAMKAAFLQGQLNLAQCPQCGTAFSPSYPLLYYDLEKELSFVLVPPDLNVAGPDQEKMIGDLTNSLVNSLPTEQRKFYLFNPTQFLSHESLIKAILEADGISEEVLEAQAARAKLIEEFLQASDEAALQEMVKARDAELDYEFFEVITAYMQMAQMAGDQARFQAFLALRTVLSELSSQGKEAVADIDAKIGLVVVGSQEELLEKMENAEDDRELEALVVTGHAMLDYAFFQMLTAKIDQFSGSGDTETAQALRDLRTKILDFKAVHEEKTQAALEQAAELLKDVVQSGAPEQELAKRLDEVDEAFFLILNANIEEARRQNQQEAAEALEAIGNMALALIQERLGPKPETDQSEEQPQILTSK